MINRLFVDIYGNVGKNIQDTSTATQTIIKSFCNTIYFDILKRVNYKDINPLNTLSTVAGQQDYPLPNDFGKEVYVLDTTNNVEIAPIDLQELVRDYPDTLSSTGEVKRYTILSSPVRKQPTSASTLSFTSSSAADTTQLIRVKGTDSNDVELDETITLTGTSAAVSTNTYKTIRSITKSASTAGRVTATSNTGAVTVAVLSPADTAYMVKIIRLHYIPNGVINLSIPYIIEPYPLVSDYDQPVIDAAVAIELGATMMTWRYKRQFSKAAEYERQYERAVDTMIWDIENNSSKTVLMGTIPYPRNDY